MGKKEKKAKKECDYFEMMVRGVKFSCKAAELLKTNLENFRSQHPAGPHGGDARHRA